MGLQEARCSRLFLERAPGFPPPTPASSRRGLRRVQSRPCRSPGHVTSRRWTTTSGRLRASSSCPGPAVCGVAGRGRRSSAAGLFDLKLSCASNAVFAELMETEHERGATTSRRAPSCASSMTSALRVAGQVLLAEGPGGRHAAGAALNTEAETTPAVAAELTLVPRSPSYALRLRPLADQGRPLRRRRAFAGSACAFRLRTSCLRISASRRTPGPAPSGSASTR